MESGPVRVFDPGTEALLADLACWLQAMRAHDNIQPRRMAVLLREFLTMDARFEAAERSKAGVANAFYELETVKPGRKTA